MFKDILIVKALISALVVSFSVTSQANEGLHEEFDNYGEYQEVNHENGVSVLSQSTHYSEVRCGNTLCLNNVNCPLNHPRIVNVKAACNLEWGSVSDSQLESVSNYTMTVVRPSDNVSDGKCNVAYSFDYETYISSGSTSLFSIVSGRDGFSFGCKEYDSSNEGECHMRVKYTCE